MKKLLTNMAILFSAITSQAQINHQINGFLFYNNNNYSTYFTLPYATPLPIQQEGFAQLNDSCPNVPVIFSTNGVNVYNGANGVVVATGLLGTPSSTNAATIVPIAGNKALIITTKAHFFTTNEAYSSVLTYTGNCTSGYTFTMPTITKNNPLPGTITNFSEKVTVVKKNTGNDYWLIMHEAVSSISGSNQYLVFSISYATGIISPPTPYFVGSFIKKYGGKGQMQAVYAQDPVLGPCYYVGAAHMRRVGSFWGSVDLLVMNLTTGALTLKELKNFGQRPYGLEFSASGSYLYVASRSSATTMKRYNPSLAAGTIFSSPVPSGTFPALPFNFFGQLQRLDNNSIYTPVVLTNTLLSIPSSSSASPTIFATATTNIGVNPFWFGLSNYWGN